MTYNPLIKTPSTDLIQSTETFSGDYFVSSGTTSITASTILGTVIQAKTGSFGNSSLDNTTIEKSINISTNIDLRTSIVNFVGTSLASDISLNNGILFIDSSTPGLVGFGTKTPASDLHVVGTLKSTGTTNILDGFLQLNTGLGTIAVVTGPDICVFSGDSSFKGTDSTMTNNTIYIDNVNKRIGVNSHVTPPLVKLHIGTADAIPVANKKVDIGANILIERSDGCFLQLVSPNNNTENCNGILFSGFVTGSTGIGRRYMSLFANWGDGNFAPANNSITVSDLGFAYLSSSLSATPFYDSINNATFAWFSNTVSFADIYFTGQHFCKPSIMDLNFYQDKVGLIVVADGTYSQTLDPTDPEETTISINESLPRVYLASKRNDKKVFGVISDKEDEQEKRTHSSGMYYSTFQKRAGDHRLIINSVGEGGIWICNINGNLENGDYITSCQIPGYGMKQDSELLMNYTVAKITCDCDFNLSSSVYKCEEFEFSGSTYRKAFVGCTYHCG